MTRAVGPVVLGIDFGTSNTVAALAVPGRSPRVLSLDGAGWLPSAVLLADDGSLAVGRDAERRARLAPERFEPNPKRRIDDGELLLGGRIVPVVDALAAVLSRVGQEARRQLDRRAPDLVTLTCPAGWGSTRRSVLLEAARRAGLGGRLTLLPEPVAAAVHFASLREPGSLQGPALAVYDLGGGTFDCAVVSTESQAYSVAAEDGLADVGGVDFDQALLDQLGRTVSAADPARWRELLRPASTADRRAARTLHEDVRNAKETLSRYSQAEVPLPEPFGDALVSRTELEGLIRPMIARTVEVLVSTVERSGYTPDRLTGIFLVGGSSRIPLVAAAIADRTGVVPTTLDQPETAVALGAALWPAVQEQRGTRPMAPGAAASGSGPVPPGPAPASGPSSPVPGPPTGPPSGSQAGPPSGPEAVPAAAGPGFAVAASPPSEEYRRRRMAAIAAVTAAVVAVVVAVTFLVATSGGPDAAGTDERTTTDVTGPTTEGSGGSGPPSTDSGAGLSTAWSMSTSLSLQTTPATDPTSCDDELDDNGLTSCLAAFAGGLSAGATCTDDPNTLGITDEQAGSFGALARVWTVCIAPDDKYWALLFQSNNAQARDGSFDAMMSALGPDSRECGTFQTSERPRGIYVAGLSSDDGEAQLLWKDPGLPLLGMLRPPGTGTTIEIADVISDFTDRSGFAVSAGSCGAILGTAEQGTATDTASGAAGSTPVQSTDLSPGSDGACPAEPLDANHMSPCVRMVSGAVAQQKTACFTDPDSLAGLQSTDMRTTSVAACGLTDDGTITTVIFLQYASVEDRATAFAALRGDVPLEPWGSGGFTGQAAFSEPETGTAKVVWDLGDLPVMAVATTEVLDGAENPGDPPSTLRELFDTVFTPQG